MPAGTIPNVTGTWCPKTAVDANMVPDMSKCVARVANIGLQTTEEGYFETLVGKDAVAFVAGMFCAKKTGDAKGACMANAGSSETLCEKRGFTEVSCPKEKCHWNPNLTGGAAP
jgi:hypothetical protein